MNSELPEILHEPSFKVKPDDPGQMEENSSDEEEEGHPLVVGVVHLLGLLITRETPVLVFTLETC